MPWNGSLLCPKTASTRSAACRITPYIQAKRMAYFCVVDIKRAEYAIVDCSC